MPVTEPSAFDHANTAVYKIDCLMLIYGPSAFDHSDTTVYEIDCLIFVN